MKRVPPSTMMQEAIGRQLNEGTMGSELALFAFTRAAVRLMLQVGLEQELTEVLGRAHYDLGGRGREGWRNGYEPLALKSTLGELDLKMPQVRETLEPFVSNLGPSLKTGKTEIQGLAAGLYTRRLSTRDIQDVFTDALGERFLSKSPVSRSVEVLRSQFASWRGNGT
jgi:transposase-like protein